MALTSVLEGKGFVCIEIVFCHAYPWATLQSTSQLRNVPLVNFKTYSLGLMNVVVSLSSGFEPICEMLMFHVPVCPIVIVCG